MIASPKLAFSAVVSGNGGMSLACHS